MLCSCSSSRFSKPSHLLVVVLTLQQTNTADMLDLAVDHIKDLQKQVKVHTKYLALNYHQNNFITSS